MLRTFCISKINRVSVTKIDLHYSGSIGVDKALLKASGILPSELVHVFNVNNGARFETYVIKEKEKSGTIALYGPASRLGHVGDILIIIAYGQVDEKKATAFKPKVVNVNKKNQIII